MIKFIRIDGKSDSSIIAVKHIRYIEKGGAGISPSINIRLKSKKPAFPSNSISIVFETIEKRDAELDKIYEILSI